MKCANVAPDGTRASGPVHTSNIVVITRDQAKAIVTNHIILVGRDVVDPADVETNTGKESLPSSDGVGTNNGVRG